MEKKLNILHFPEWYPHEEDDMEGIFIRKHVEAIHLQHTSRVIFCRSRQQKPWISSIVNIEKGIKVVRTFYKKHPTGIPLVDRFIRKALYLKSVQQSLRIVHEDGFKEDLLHLHVCDRNMKFTHRFYNQPYVITEHWSKYLHLQKLNTMTVEFFNRSQGISVVSEVLHQALKQLGVLKNDLHLIPNVVENTLFHYKETPKNNDKKVLLHVSEFNEESKNILGLLKAIKELGHSRDDFKLLLVGYGKNKKDILKFIEKHQLRHLVCVLNKTYPKDLVKLYQQADLFVLNSRYETFGVVIAEALMCGCPVVSTRVGVAPELIHKKNGILVDNSLAKALDEALNKNFDRMAIANEVKATFDIETIATHFSTFYQKALT